jgi:hypothetical protein
MALDYTGASAGIFTRAGKFVKYLNSRLATAVTTLPAELKAIADLFEAADLTNQISGLYADYDGFKANVTSERQRLAKYLDTILTDRDTVLADHGGQRDRRRDHHRPPRPAPADGRRRPDREPLHGDHRRVVAAAGNVGNGTVITSKLLDGYTAPLAGGADRHGVRGPQLRAGRAVRDHAPRVHRGRRPQRAGGRAGAVHLVGRDRDTKLGYKSEGSGSARA